MIQWCGNEGGGNAGAPCSCSILFPFSERKAVEEDDVGGASTSPVDCTLSLGTPYTRHQSSALQRSSSVSSFSWDKLTQTEKCSATARGGSSVSGGDPFLLARRCANCDTTSTPLWRNGPRGPKSLCNACGIRYKKEERRAAASSANSSITAQGVGESISYLYPRGQPQHPWGCYAPSASTDSTAKRSVLPMYAGEADQDQKEAFLPWRLSVVPPQFPAGDRGGLFQYQ